MHENDTQPAISEPATTSEKIETITQRVAALNSKEELTADTILGKEHFHIHGRVEDLVKNMDPGTYKLPRCPFHPLKNCPDGKGSQLIVRKTGLTVFCYAPEEHGHSPDDIRTTTDHRPYAVWSWYVKDEKKQEIVKSSDESTLATYCLEKLGYIRSHLAWRDGDVWYYNDAQEAIQGHHNINVDPYWGCWERIPRVALAEYVRRTLHFVKLAVPKNPEKVRKEEERKQKAAEKAAKKNKTVAVDVGVSLLDSIQDTPTVNNTPTPDGEELELHPLHIQKRTVENVIHFMLQTLHMREHIYMDVLVKSMVITLEQREKCNSRFDATQGSLLRPGSALLHDGTQAFALPKHHIGSDSRIGYDPNPQHLPEWEAYVAQMVPDADDQRALQMWMGAALVGGCATKLQQHIIMQGPPGTGKSQILRLLASVFPESQVSGVPVGKLSERFTPSLLVGKRLNVSPEADTESGRFSDIGTFKALLDGSTVMVERKGEQGFPVILSCGHLIGANSLPVGDSGGAFFDRFRIIKATTVRRRQTDEQIVDFAATKAYWKPAILHWAIEGLALLNKAGWRLPQSKTSTEAKDDWRRESDSVFDWHSQLPKGEGVWLKARTVYQHYTAWCQAGGRKELSETKFGGQFKTLCPNSFKRHETGMQYKVDLLTPDEGVTELQEDLLIEKIREAWNNQDEGYLDLATKHPKAFKKFLDQDMH